jgi:hypothetical protein
LGKILQEGTDRVLETEGEPEHKRESPAASPIVELEEVEVVPSNEGTQWAYLVVGLGAGLALVATGAWFLLRRRSGG